MDMSAVAGVGHFPRGMVTAVIHGATGGSSHGDRNRAAFPVPVGQGSFQAEQSEAEEHDQRRDAAPALPAERGHAEVIPD